MKPTDLAPATRKRSTLPAPAPAAAAGDEVAPELTARLAAVETTLRTIDVRLEALEREVRDGFREEALRAATLARIEASVDAIPPIPDLTRLERHVEGLLELQTTVADLAVGLRELRAPVDLVAERIATLLGGPSLTELMDRIDELERNVNGAPAEAKRRRRRTEPLETGDRARRGE